MDMEGCLEKEDPWKSLEVDERML